MVNFQINAYVKRAVILLGLVSGILLLTSCSTSINNVKMWFPPEFSGMQRKSVDLVIEASASAEDITNLRKMNDVATERLNVVWPVTQSKPELWVCLTETCYQNLGGGSPKAKSFGSRILISPRGLSTGIISHERWHSEFVWRIGIVKAFEIPRWFDEGVAVWVSQYPLHSEEMYQRVLDEKITPPALSALITFKDWDRAVGRYGDHLKSDDSSPNVVYPTAGHEIRRWISVVGIDGLRQLVDRIAAGEDFSAVYLGIEQEVKR